MQLLTALKDYIRVGGKTYPTYQPHLTLAHKLATEQREVIEAEIKGLNFKEELRLDQLVLYKLVPSVGDEGQTNWQAQRVWQLRP